MIEKEKQVLVARFDKNSAEEIQVHLVEWKGQQYVDIRLWYKPEPGVDRGLHPSTKGIRLNVELLSELRKAIDKVIAEIELDKAAAFADEALKKTAEEPLGPETADVKIPF
jgi:hypothetical protein